MRSHQCQLTYLRIFSHVVREEGSALETCCSCAVAQGVMVLGMPSLSLNEVLQCELEQSWIFLIVYDCSTCFCVAVLYLGI